MKVELTLYAIILCILIMVSSACYGAHQIYTYSDRQQQLEDYKYIINDQKIKIAHLRNLNDYVAAMEQVLTSQQLAELKALALMINRERHRNYEAIEQPLITEKDR